MTGYPFYPSISSILDEFFSVDTPKDTIVRTSSAFPKINVFKNKDGDFIFQASFAGYKKEEIDVSIENERQLVLQGNKKSDEENVYFVKELTTSSFKRKILLPDFFDTENIETSYEDGILTLKFKLKEEKKPKKLLLT